jgi:putative cobalt transporter subunit CbtA
MMRSLLLRGMLAGALAAVLAFAFAKVFGEPEVGRAIGFEEHLDRLAGRSPGAEVVSRDVQSTIGLLLAVLVYGVALGGLFALAFAYAFGRIAVASARGVAAVLAGGGFLAVGLVPFVKYPPNPPSVGHPETIDHRTVLFFCLIAITLCAALAAVRVCRAAGRRLGPSDARLAGAGAFVVLVAVAAAVLPGVHEVPRAFPAEVLWRFRLSSLGLQAVLWAGIGIVFGALAERAVGSAGFARGDRLGRVGGPVR